MNRVVLAAAVLGTVTGLDVAMNDPAIVYSPYTWLVTESMAKTINPGAYFKVEFAGPTVTLHTNTTGMFRMGSQFWTRVDGGPLVQHVLVSDESPSYTVSAGPPFSASDYHLLEVIVKSTTETASRWAPQSTAVIFTGMTTAPPAAPKWTVRAPHRKKFNILIYGDSITEGVRTLGYVGIANDTDRNDAVRDYSLQLATQLPAEIGVVAFGATGVNKGGSGGVPLLTESWNQLWDGQPRDFKTNPPDLIIYNEGTNDGSNNITVNFLTVVKGILAVAPKSKQLLLLPFNGGQRANILQVVAQSGSDSVVFGDTTGFYDGSDGLHPFGYNHISQIAPQVAALCYPLL